MLDSFLFLALPYLAIVGSIAGSIWRYRRSRFSYSALSSQFLESRRLLFGSLPFHLGLLVLFLGHLIPFLFPGLWTSFLANRAALYCVETLGIVAALLTFFGLASLLYRRLLSARLQRVTTTFDLLLLGLLLTQVLLGLGVATLYRWGARWSAGTLAPYLWGILTFRPDPAWVSGMPPLVKLHLVGAWLILLILPFTRLVHLFSFPFRYAFRPPQRVIWASARRLSSRTPSAVAAFESRRHFVKGAAGVTAAAGLLAVGVLDKLAFFFRGPRLSPAEEQQILQNRLERLNATVKQRQLELERMREPFLFVARLSELDPKTGKYFTDYNMRPAMAFLDAATGLPRLISAKCTHLGCTVANHVDKENHILCPCHFSYFDIATGKPTPGSPAKAPLPLLGYVVQDAGGKVLCRKPPNGALEGSAAPAALKTASVYIAREFASEEG